MEVQFFKQPELIVVNQSPESIARHKELCRELGIVGISTEQTSEEIIAIYHPLNAYERKCLGVLCQQNDKLEDYCTAPIPLEILEEIKILKKAGVFDEFRVLHSVEEPDPILIGKRWKNDEDRENGYSWNKQEFLIARWGDEAKPLSDLCRLATIKAAEMLRRKILEYRAEVMSWEGRENDLAELMLNGKSSLGGYISL